MKVFVLIKCYIDYKKGSGGHFLRHFLDPQIQKTQANFWVDKEYHPKEGGGDNNLDAYPYSSDSVISFGNKYPKIFTIGLGPTNIVEFIKVMVLINLKNRHTPIDNFDSIITDIQLNNLNLFDTSSVSFMINYENLFVLDVLKKLYTDLHNTPVPEHKISFFKSYKQKHDKVFNSWQYKVIEKICLFEYNNNVIESLSGKIRGWGIDQINQYNWQEFLEEKLCLTNYH